MYFEGLKGLAAKGYFTMPDIPEYATNNGHMFFLVCRNLDERTKLIAYLKEQGVGAVFHYLSLHLSDYYRDHHEGEIPSLPNCDRFADCLVRLPMYFELTDEEANHVITSIIDFFK
jgi:dTDP-4-amino-4,6-dideoxygalactose transaminase